MHHAEEVPIHDQGHVTIPNQLMVAKTAVNQGWRQESSDKGADASDGGADYFGTRILKADGSSETSIERCQHYWHCVAVQ